MNKNSVIYVAGANGMVGSSIVRNLKSSGFENVLTPSSKVLDLMNQAAVNSWFEENKPDYVFLAAAKVGGIHANNIYRGEFLYNNLMIEANVIHASKVFNVKKLLFLGSSCIYPKFAEQPIKEESLLTGFLEPTNEPYAIAKIAGIKLCENYRDQYDCDFISAMPTNLYGPNDNYNLKNSHVLPALIRKFEEAKRRGDKHVELWGTGVALREFLHVDDLAEACVFLMRNYSDAKHINVGSSMEVSIKDLAQKVKDVVGFEGDINWNTDMPDGTPRKLMDNTQIESLGWKASITIDKGLEITYKDFLNNFDRYTEN